MTSPVVYVTTNGLGEPHVTSQILPYLEAQRERRFSLITFEKADAPEAEQRAAHERLAKSDISWAHLTHRAPPLGTLWNLAQGSRLVTRTVEATPTPSILHARSYVAAAIATRAARATRRPWIFDMRGFYLDERIDSGALREGSMTERALRKFETRLVADADRIVVLTTTAKTILESGRMGRVTAPIVVVPCCVDLHAFRPATRAPANPPTLAYSGTLGAGYLEREMAEFAGAFRKAVGGARFLVASRQPSESFCGQLAQAGYRSADVEALRLMPHEVPAALRRASAGIVFVRASFAKLAASPIKVGEYLATGCPVAISQGCGDATDLVERERVGVSVDTASSHSMIEGARRLAALVADASTRERCRRVAERYYDVANGAEEYRRLYASLDRENA